MTRWRSIAVMILAAGIAGLFPVRLTQSAYFVFFSEEDVLQVAFANGETVVEVDWTLMSRETRKKIESELGQALVFRRMQCFQGAKEGRVVGYACIDNVIGRSKPITYMVKINHPKGDLAHYEIMVYREEIGKETGFGPFREQFYGKTRSDPFQYGNDLRNYSGATLSANGLRDGFVKMLAVYDHFFKTLPVLAPKSG
jgi:hypothetical protein